MGVWLPIYLWRRGKGEAFIALQCLVTCYEQLNSFIFICLLDTKAIYSFASFHHLFSPRSHSSSKSVARLRTVYELLGSYYEVRRTSGLHLLCWAHHSRFKRKNWRWHVKKRRDMYSDTLYVYVLGLTALLIDNPFRGTSLTPAINFSLSSARNLHPSQQIIDQYHWISCCRLYSFRALD